MSLLSDLFSSLSGDKTGQAVTERPCANCPSDCAIAGEACAVCEPYKKQLIDVLYYVDHLDEYYARYEVAGLSGDQTANCPHCGARSANPLVCEYCGSKLSDGTGRIKVENASDIPNPITQAQDIIFERADRVIKQYAKNSSSKGILGELLSSVTGSSSGGEYSGLGAKMSEDEIKEAASLYGVSLSEYLTGLDNGKYLTLAGKKAQDSGSYASSGTSGVPSGLAAVGMIAAALLGGRARGQRPPRLPDSRRREPYTDPRPQPNRDGQRSGQRPDARVSGRPGGYGGNRGPGGPGGNRGPGGPSGNRSPGGYGGNRGPGSPGGNRGPGGPGGNRGPGGSR